MRFLILLSFFTSTIFGLSANDISQNKRDPTNAFFITRFVGFNADGVTNSFYFMANDATNPRPVRADLPSYIVYDATGQAISIQNLPQSAVSGLVAALANIPGAPSQSSASRTIGTSGWQLSTTRNATVSYSVSIATALSLTGGSAGYVSLEIASDSGYTTNLQEVARVTNAQTGTLTIGLALNQTISATLSGFVPAGYYARLKSTNITGTPTYTYVVGQETLN